MSQNTVKKAVNNSDGIIPSIKRLQDAVINRIAAGEIIQRPANAVKELLENSLDAGSTFVNITIKSGGLKMLKIVDNGHGIKKDDMEIVCERFTTSKLRDFQDLKSISTFGFRGEALASISHVGHLSITSRTKTSKCAYKAPYVHGKLVSSPQACAGNVGTQILVEDLFYNVPTRRKAFKNDSEEQQKVAAVVSKYAIHNSGISFTLRKSESGQIGSVLMQTQSGATLSDNISVIYGSNIGKELLFISQEDAKLKLKINGAITNANCSLKKLIFLLFINNRLVECSSLKHALETLYQSYLPKGTHSFMYISLEMPPNNLDVNVHPTKHQVHFLNEEEIVECVTKCVETRLLSCDKSRTFYTQKLFSPVTKDELKDKENLTTNKVYDHHLVRSDSKLQKLDAFFNKSPNDNSRNDEIKTKKPISSFPSIKNSELTVAKYPKRRKIRLTSVLQLQEDISTQVSDELLKLFRGHIFVGVINPELAILQHKTKLYLMNTTKLTQELFYQILIKDFGNFAMFRLSEPAPLRDLAILGLDSELSGWTPADGNKSDLADFLVNFFKEKSEMLRDYFCIDVKDGSVVGLPMLLKQYIPPMEGLPFLMLRLATEVNWEDEKECFVTLCRELAKFYSVRKGFADYDDMAQSGDVPNKEANEESMEVDTKPRNKASWQWTVEFVIYRALKQHFNPSNAMIDNQAILQLANLPDLYKVFERC